MTPTSDTTPDYTFTTNEAGTISYGGDCSSITTSASLGSNTITFSALTVGVYSNCTLIVTDEVGNISNSLTITTFTINAVVPVPESTPAPQNVSQSSGGSSSSTQTSPVSSLPAVSPAATPTPVPRPSILVPKETKTTPFELITVRGSENEIRLGSTVIVTDKGKVEQKIQAVAGSSVTLSIVPKEKVVKIKGYLVFKRKPKKITQELPLGSQAATALLSLTSPTRVAVGAPPQIEDELLVESFEYTDPDGDGIFTAILSVPRVDGEYEVVAVIDYQNEKSGSQELRMLTVVDPEGYVYKQNSDGGELRLSGMKVSIWSMGSTTAQLWDAARYKQENPQITDKTGSYSFLVPPGRYYVTAESEGYLPYKSHEFDVVEGKGIHFNIEMHETASNIAASIDWKILLIGIFGIALAINFVNDMRLRRQLLKKKCN